MLVQTSLEKFCAPSTVPPCDAMISDKVLWRRTHGEKAGPGASVDWAASLSEDLWFALKVKVQKQKAQSTQDDDCSADECSKHRVFLVLPGLCSGGTPRRYSVCGEGWCVLYLPDHLPWWKECCSMRICMAITSLCLLTRQQARRRTRDSPLVKEQKLTEPSLTLNPEPSTQASNRKPQASSFDPLNP